MGDISIEGALEDEVTGQSELQSNGSDIMCDTEWGQHLNTIVLITDEGASEAEIKGYSEFLCNGFESNDMEVGQNLDIGSEITVEDEIVDQSTLESIEHTGRHNIAVTHDLDIIGDTFMADESVESLDDNSIGELVGDVSFDGCVDSNIKRTENTRGRKRSRNPENWKRNKAKRSCNTGQRYVNIKGKIKKAKTVKKGCGLKCRFQCHSAFTEEDRENISHSYWKLGDVTQQRQFLLKYSAPQKKKSKKQCSNRKREKSFMWTLPLNGTPVRVCKTFFLHTLNISPQKIHTAFKKSQNIIETVEKEQRGSHSNRPNKIPQNKIDLVVSHINSFPAIESHYCRKDSKKMYLSPDLSVAKMYKLYLEQCARSEIVAPVSLNMYRETFNTHFNIAFQKPIKDQCDLCSSYKNATKSDKMKMKEKYDSHIKNKTLARENKEKDKQTAQKTRMNLL